VIERIKKSGRHEGYSFAGKYDLCMSYFQKVQSVFTPVPKPDRPDQVNVSISISANYPGLSGIGAREEKPATQDRLATLCSKSDISFVQMLDPQTLEPIGLARQKSLHPSLVGMGSATHAKSDPNTGDVYNFNLNFGRTGTYRVFGVSASTGTTSVLATVYARPSYVHSLFLTEHYVILCVWNAFYYLGGVTIPYHKNLVDALATFDGSQPAKWFVVDRTPAEAGGKGLVATYESDAFFAFHSINAFEEKGGQAGEIDIVADVVAYDNNDIIKRFYLDNLMSDSPTAKGLSDKAFASCRSSFRQHRLCNVHSGSRSQPRRTELVFSDGAEFSVELPTINQSMLMRKHRYVYCVTDTGNSSFFDGLVKYDIDTRSGVQWHQHGQTAGEPIFVADPTSTDEDGGVVLSVVLDGIKGKSYLLVLDAKTMKEVGRAKVDGPVGFGFHGTHVSARSDARPLDY
jgi:torulene dioxygenase